MDGTSIRLAVSTVIPDVFTVPRDLAVARAESQYSDRLLLAWEVVRPYAKF